MDLFDQHLGVEWRANLTNPEFWETVDNIPDGLLWGVHQNLKRRMIDRIRERTTGQRMRNGEGPAAIRDAGMLLDPDRLTLGFARRFATYKRATLIFNDLERMERLVNDPERPVQLVFAGKAHPADVPGQEFIRRIHEISQMPAFRGRIVLVEGYDISIARYLVSGVDIWLNTPRRPYEASGTSGMKVAMNGGINFSVLDGWWCEAARQDVNGWSIGDARDVVGNEARLSDQDALTLYQTLEETIVPLYYTRNAQGVPAEWIAVAKNSMKTIPPIFNTDRMVSEYGRRFYFPAITKGRRLVADDFALSRELSAWKASMRKTWPEVSIRWGAAADGPRLVTYGEEVEVAAEVRLGPIAPEDVLVEAYVTENDHEPHEGAHRIPMQPVGPPADGFLTYRTTFVPPDSGRYAVTVRATPYHPELIHPYEIGLIRWLGVDSDAVSAMGRPRRLEDRRQHKRESLAPFTELFPEDGGEPVSGYPTDMSRGGLALESDVALPVDSRVTVGVHFDPVVADETGESDDAPVEFISALVTRVAPMGKRHKISVVFEGLSEADHPLLWGVLSFIDR